jgi:hypothetical protein
VWNDRGLNTERKAGVSGGLLTLGADALGRFLNLYTAPGRFRESLKRFEELTAA